jgi:hypothetical protein
MRACAATRSDASAASRTPGWSRWLWRRKPFLEDWARAAVVISAARRRRLRGAAGRPQCVAQPGRDCPAMGRRPNRDERGASAWLLPAPGAGIGVAGAHSVTGAPCVTRCHTRPERSGRRRSVAPEQPRELALNAHAIGRQDPHFVGRIGRLEGDRGATAAEAFERRFLVVDQRHHDVAGLGRL